MNKTKHPFQPPKTMSDPTPQDQNIPVSLGGLQLSDDQLLKQLEQQYASDPRYHMSQSELLAQLQQQPNSDLIRWQLDTEDYLQQTYKDLTHAEYDNVLKKWKPNKYLQLINDKGAKIVLSIMRSRVNKGIKLSSFETEEIGEIMINLMREVIWHLALKHQEYEIDRNNLGIISGIIETQAYAELKRAHKHLTLNFLRTTERRIETYADKPTQNTNLSDTGRKKILGLF